MISPDEFLSRCERVRVVFAVEGSERQKLTRELAALCTLTGARAESLYDHNAQLTGLRVCDPGGNLVISAPVDEVLAELVATQASCEEEEPILNLRHVSGDSGVPVQRGDKLAAMIQSWHKAAEFELQRLEYFTETVTPDTPHLDLVGTDQIG